MKTMLFLSVLMLCSCSTEEGNDSNKQHQVRTIKISTAQSVVQDVILYEKVIGSIEDEQLATVTAQVNGSVKKVWVDAGSQVQKGDILVDIEPDDNKANSQQAQAAVSRLQVAYKAQKRLLQRYETLGQEGFISTQMLDATKDQLQVLEKSLQGSRAQLRQQNNQLRRTRVFAPFSGKIQTRHIAQGDFVMAGKPLFLLLGQQNLLVRAPFPERLLGIIQTGQRVILTTVSGKKRQSLIHDMSPMVSKNGAFDALIRVKQQVGWLAGSRVTVQVQVGLHVDAVLVPQEAVVLRPEGETVYCIHDAKAMAVLVQTGVSREGWIEVMHGLKEGVTVAVKGAPFLSDGAVVQLVDNPA